MRSGTMITSVSDITELMHKAPQLMRPNMCFLQADYVGCVRYKKAYHTVVASRETPNVPSDDPHADAWVQRRSLSRCACDF